MSEEADAPIEGFKALAHPLRYSILATLADGEHNVGEIEAAGGIGQPALSQQLAILRKAQLVTTRRDAKQVYYAIAPEQLRRILQAVANLAPGDQTDDLIGVREDPHASVRGAAVFARLNI